MNCPECQELLQRRLDGESAAAWHPDLDSHLAACPPCRELHAAAQRLLDGLLLFHPPAVPSGLAGRISAQVVSDLQKARRARRWLVATTLAAGLLLAAFLAAPAKHRPGPTPLPPLAARGSEEQRGARSEERGRKAADSRRAGWRQRPEPRGSSLAPRSSLLAPRSSSEPFAPIQEAGLAVVALTRGLADDTVDQGRVLLPVVLLPSRAGARPRSAVLEPPVDPLRALQQGVSEGLEPVATSARRALDLFLQEIPPPEPKRRTGA